MIRLRLFVCTRDAVWVVDVVVIGRRVAPVRLKPLPWHHELRRRHVSAWVARQN